MINYQITSLSNPVHRMWLVMLPLIAFVVHDVSALECYVCKNQDSNNDKCVETVKTCDIGQDRCLTEVRWGGTPYWAPSGEKQHYISKRCASELNCTAERAFREPRCDRIWYNDWECVECCHGDRCNYYVTLSGHQTMPSIAFLLLSTVLAIFLLR